MPSERSWIIGAAPDCDVVVNLPTVSGRHCRLFEGAAGFLLEDLGSTNGTYVNGRKIATAVRVRKTDVILMGSRVAMPWPDLSAPEADRTGPQLSAAAARRQADRRLIAGAACGLALSLGLVVYALLDRGDSRGSAASGSQESNGDSGSGLEANAQAGGETTNPPMESLDGERETVIASRGSVRLNPHYSDAPRSEQKQTAMPGIETAVEPVEPGVVWLGFRLRDYAFPHASGWLVRGDLVATTASVVAELEPFNREDFEVVAYHAGKVIPVKSLRRHPGYDAANPGGQVSIHSNVGLVQLAEPLHPVLQVASQEELRSLGQATPLLAVGFESELGEREPFDELKVRLFRGRAKLERSEIRPATSTRVYMLTVGTPKCCEGAPVFNNRGHVAGVLAVVSGKPMMVPASQFATLLEGGKRAD